MKTVLFALLLTVLTFSACEKGEKSEKESVQTTEVNVPPHLKANFDQMFKGVSLTEWEKTNIGDWKVKFINKGIKTKATYDNSGVLKELSEKISATDIPAHAKDNILKSYPGSKIEEVKRLTDANGTISYEIEINDKDLLFDFNGGFIKEITDEHD